MGRVLRYVGLVALALAAWLLIAEEAAWLPGGTTGSAVQTLLGGGMVCLVAGILYELLSRVRHKLKKGRCVRCGAAIERGQSYCLDHLRETLNEYQDRSRENHMRRPGELI
jgi:predicted nucleic acid-binding Zn ribbon protein